MAVKKNLARVANVLDGLHRELIAVGLVCLCVFSLIQSEKTNEGFKSFHAKLVTACISRNQQTELNVERERKLAATDAQSPDPAIRAGAVLHKRFIEEQATTIFVNCKSL